MKRPRLGSGAVISAGCWVRAGVVGDYGGQQETVIPAVFVGAIGGLAGARAQQARSIPGAAQAAAADR